MMKGRTIMKEYMNASLAPKKRAELLLNEMTLDEKMAQITGVFAFPGKEDREKGLSALKELCAEQLKDQFLEAYGEEDFNFCWRMKKAKVKGACLKETLVYHKVHAASDKTGAKAGKVAAYFLNRIIDMRKFYSRPVWEIWRRVVVLLVIADSLRKQIPFKTIKEVLRIIRKYSHNTQLTYADCIEMGRF